MNKWKLLFNFILALIILTICVLGLYFAIDNNKFIYYVYWLIFVYGISLTLSLYVYFSKRHSEVKLNWIILFFLLPIVSDILFLCFGTFPFKRYKKKDFDTLQNQLVKAEDYHFTNKYLKDNASSIFRYAFNKGKRPVSKNNTIEPISDNATFLNSLLDEIKKAKDFIHVQSYCIKDGIVSRALFTELAKKAKAGVKVRVLFDWIGSFGAIKSKTIKSLRKAGVEVASFNKHWLNLFNGGINFRNHRKVIVIDNKVAIFGGSNISDKYFGIKTLKRYWRDQNFIIKGEVVNSLNLIFCLDWYLFTKTEIKKVKRQEVVTAFENNIKVKSKNGDSLMQVVDFSPFYSQYNIKDLFIKLIYGAKKEVLITSPFFFIDDEVRNALVIAAHSGVKVKIVTPSVCEWSFISIANRSNYKELINAGCEIYEYGSFIHSKLFVIDQKYAIVGSSNFDFRSLYINFESGILIESTTSSKKIRDIILNNISHSQLITKDSKILKPKLSEKLQSILIHFLYETL